MCSVPLNCDFIFIYLHVKLLSRWTLFHQAASLANLRVICKHLQRHYLIKVELTFFLFKLRYQRPLIVFTCVLIWSATQVLANAYSPSCDFSNPYVTHQGNNNLREIQSAKFIVLTISVSLVTLVIYQ